jgi:hypothetical protein
VLKSNFDGSGDDDASAASGQGIGDVERYESFVFDYKDCAAIQWVSLHATSFPIPPRMESRPVKAAFRIIGYRMLIQTPSR